jgi:hypothetical protein
MTREQCITQKVETDFGSHYVHVSHVGHRITGISISSPGKFDDSALAGMLGALSEAATGVIADIAASTSQPSSVRLTDVGATAGGVLPWSPPAVPA